MEFKNWASAELEVVNKLPPWLEFEVKDLQKGIESISLDIHRFRENRGSNQKKRCQESGRGMWTWEFWGKRGYLFKNDKHIIAVITGVTADHEKALSFCN
ncbi:hypothetical protein [Archaeoglobus sp.]